MIRISRSEKIFVKLLTFGLITSVPVSVVVAGCSMKAADEWKLRPVTAGEKDIE